MGPEPDVEREPSPARPHSRPSRSGGQTSLNLPAEPLSARHARRFVAATLRQAGCVDDELLYRLALVTGELVTNAVLHARTDIEVRVVLDGPVVGIEVLDGNIANLRRVAPGPGDSGGRGLMLVDALVDDWGVVDVDGDHEPGKAKKVWVRVVGW